MSFGMMVPSHASRNRAACCISMTQNRKVRSNTPNSVETFRPKLLTPSFSPHPCEGALATRFPPVRALRAISKNLMSTRCLFHLTAKLPHYFFIARVLHPTRSCPSHAHNASIEHLLRYYSLASDDLHGNMPLPATGKIAGRALANEDALRRCATPPPYTVPRKKNRDQDCRPLFLHWAALS